MSKNICRNCNKQGDDHSQCAKCKDAWYCSRECQVADWKNGHKGICGTARTKTQKAHDLEREFGISYIQNTQWELMHDIYHFTKQKNVKKQNVLVQIDFFRGDDRLSPAEEGVIHMEDVTKYLSDEKALPKSMYRKGFAATPSAQKEMRKLIGEQHSRMTPDHILVFITFRDMKQSAMRIALNEPVTGSSMTSDTVLELIGKGIDGKGWEGVREHFIDNVGLSKRIERDCAERAKETANELISQLMGNL
jgi:hypothetical protein